MSIVYACKNIPYTHWNQIEDWTFKLNIEVEIDKLNSMHMLKNKKFTINVKCCKNIEVIVIQNRKEWCSTPSGYR